MVAKYMIPGYEILALRRLHHQNLCDYMFQDREWLRDELFSQKRGIYKKRYPLPKCVIILLLT